MKLSNEEDRISVDVIIPKHILCIIQLFHEVICEAFPGAVQDHPHMILFSDGGGHIVSTRTKRYNSDKYPDGVLFTFYGMDELVRKADELVAKYGKAWRKYVNEERESQMGKFVDFYLDHIYVGCTSFNRWSDPEKALGPAIRLSAAVADAAEKDQILGISCDESQQIVRITTKDMEKLA